MSIELDLQTALLAHAPLVVVVGQRVAVDEVPEDWARPYIAFVKQFERIERGLDNSVHGHWATMDVQCVGDSRSQALEIAALVRDAMEAAGQPPDQIAAGYDPDNDIEAEVVTVDWWL